MSSRMSKKVFQVQEGINFDVTGSGNENISVNLLKRPSRRSMSWTIDVNCDMDSALLSGIAGSPRSPMSIMSPPRKVPRGSLSKRIDKRQSRRHFGDDDDERNENEMSDDEEQVWKLNLEAKFQEVLDRKQALLNVQKQTCFEHILHSKAVVEKHLEDEENRRMFLQQRLEAKLEHARKRRRAILETRRENARKTVQFVYATVQRVKSVKIVQTWWKKQKLAMKRFNRLQSNNIAKLVQDVLDPIQDSDLSFEEVAQHLCQPVVLQSACKMIQTVCLPPNAKPTHASTGRTFLTSLMVNRYADVVLALNEQEGSTGDIDILRMKNNLTTVAKIIEKYLHQLKMTCSQPGAGNIATANKAILMLRAASDVFADVLGEWKRRDAEMIAEDLLKMYILVSQDYINTKAAADELERKTGTTDANPGLVQFLQGLEDQRSTLKLKASKMLSPAKFEQWAARATAALEVESLVYATEQFENADAVEDSENDEEVRQRAESFKQKVHHSRFAVHSREQNIYELLLNPSYKLTRANLSGTSGPVMIEGVGLVDADEYAGKVLTQELHSNKFDFFLSILEHIKERLSNLTPNRDDLREALNEGIDTEFIKQKLSTGAFEKMDMVKLVEFMCEKLLLLQSAGRDEETKEWMTSLDVKCQDENKYFSWKDLASEALSNILKSISNIELDVANAHLALLARYILADNMDESVNKGVSYLREKLEQEVSKGDYELGGKGVPKKTETFFSVDNSEDKKILNVVVTGFAKVLTVNKRNFEDFVLGLPETVARFDAERSFNLNMEIKKISLLVTLEIIFCQFGEPSKQQRVAFRNVMAEKIDEIGMENLNGKGQGKLLKDSFLTCLENVKGSVSKEVAVRVEQSLCNIMTDALFASILRRFEKVLSESLKSATMDENSLSRTVFKVWKAEVKDIVERARNMVRVNTLVFRPWYEKI